MIIDNINYNAVLYFRYVMHDIHIVRWVQYHPNEGI